MTDLAEAARKQAARDRARCGEWSPSGALRCVLEVSHADEHLFGERPTEPRTWSLPPEPGPEVTAVRATEGAYGLTLWRREPLAWNLRRADGKLLCSCRSWLRLLQRYGPLTDATGEVQP
jgi:hypothetical protein